MIRILILCLLCLNTIAASTVAGKPPRQKIEFKGLINSATPSALSVAEIEKNFPLNKVTIFDPYNNYEETVFEGIYLYTLLNKYSKNEATKVKVLAIDGYSVDIPFTLVKKDNMFLAIKDQKGYLKVDRMGPARIIYPEPKKIDKDTLLRIGINWVWQIKTFEFTK